MVHLPNATAPPSRRRG